MYRDEGPVAVAEMEEYVALAYEWEDGYIAEITLSSGEKIVWQADSLKELGWDMHVAVREYETDAAKGFRG